VRKRIEEILNEFVEKWQPDGIDLYVALFSSGSGVHVGGVRIELKY
jgi:hypothetical protein